MNEYHFSADVMLRQPRFRASRASPAQKSRGLRVELSQKLFKGYIFCFLGHSVGRYVFELFAFETNLKKKHSVMLNYQSDRLRQLPQSFVVHLNLQNCEIIEFLKRTLVSKRSCHANL